ncbi:MULTISPECIES: hypothetical protein [unclassified Frigoribacterium]|jgi:hypothetical protein|uniref:hypothetical protein n=1 Tax=unclassified Frigoribacterium TaxID=2627005 RepID=UPI000B0D4597|nr:MULTISPECIES: hypothetical protein [unclassified Frigoribacterium]MBD8538365.1 hypothetical protein [Frigoribacterium sp. CFBP 8751]
MSALSDSVLTVTTRLLAQPQTPDPTLPPSTIPDEAVTPGVWGFVAIAFVAIATVLIVVDMTRRVRRTRYRGEVRERIQAERDEATLAAAALDDEELPGDADRRARPVEGDLDDDADRRRREGDS